MTDPQTQWGCICSVFAVSNNGRTYVAPLGLWEDLYMGREISEERNIPTDEMKVALYKTEN